MTMIIYDRKQSKSRSHSKAYNKKASVKDYPPADAFRIEYPGVITLRELEQALWEDMRQLEDLCVKYIDNGKLYLPLVNEYGETVWLQDENGRSPGSWKSQAYRSLVSDYKL